MTAPRGHHAGGEAWSRVFALKTGMFKMNLRWYLYRRVPKGAPIWWHFLEHGTPCLAGSLWHSLPTLMISMPSPWLAVHWEWVQSSNLNRISLESVSVLATFCVVPGLPLTETWMVFVPRALWRRLRHCHGYLPFSQLCFLSSSLLRLKAANCLHLSQQPVTTVWHLNIRPTICLSQKLYFTKKKNYTLHKIQKTKFRN